MYTVAVENDIRFVFFIQSSRLETQVNISKYMEIPIQFICISMHVCIMWVISIYTRLHAYYVFTPLNASLWWQALFCMQTIYLFPHGNSGLVPKLSPFCDVLTSRNNYQGSGVISKVESMCDIVSITKSSHGSQLVNIFQIYSAIHF